MLSSPVTAFTPPPWLVPHNSLPFRNGSACVRKMRFLRFWDQQKKELTSSWYSGTTWSKVPISESL